MLRVQNLQVLPKDWAMALNFHQSADFRLFPQLH
jgi:hypothetical protein